MATNFVSATYTEIIDLQTTPDSVSIMGIHTPQGTAPYERLKGFFEQFRKFRYNGCSLTMIPAANLPVDPLGLTGQPQTTDLMDPRDALNPILAHGAHGESLDAALNHIYTKSIRSTLTAAGIVEDVDATANDNIHTADSADLFDVDISKDLELYYDKLTDRTWRKFGIQQPIHLSKLHPLVHRVVQNMPTVPSMPGSAFAPRTNAGLMSPIDPSNTTMKNVISNTTYSADYAATPAGELDTISGWLGDVSVSANTYKQQFTNRMERLGWLPTSVADGTYNSPVLLPKCFMQVLVMPPAYNVTQFFRCSIKHSFSFSGFTSSLGLMGKNPRPIQDTVPPYHNWIDYGSSIDSIGAKSTVISDGVA